MEYACNGCGKVYNIQDSQLERYRGRSIKLRCTSCQALTDISQVLQKMDGATIPVEEIIDDRHQPITSIIEPEKLDDQSGWLGLRGKILLLFLMLPVLMMAAAGYNFQHQLNKVTGIIIEKSRNITIEGGKKQILQKARDVALHCETYLKQNQKQHIADVKNDPNIQVIAVQSIGDTGYTALVEYPTSEEGGTWKFIAHPDTAIISTQSNENPTHTGTSDYSSLIKTLDSFSEGKESSDYYRFTDANGQILQMFLAAFPVNIEGMPLMIIATASMNELYHQTDEIAEEANVLKESIKKVNLTLVIGALVILGLCIIIYGYRLTQKIIFLTEAADRISVGDLDTEIHIKSKDEIGELANAIGRMQDSLKFSIRRLQRKGR